MLNNPVGPKPKRDNKNLIIQAGVILIGLIAGYYYYTGYIKGELEPIVVTDIKANDNLSKFKDIKSLDFNLFAEQGFRVLKIIGEAPVLPGATGRGDIFAPF